MGRGMGGTISGQHWIYTHQSNSQFYNDNLCGPVLDNWKAKDFHKLWMFGGGHGWGRGNLGIGQQGRDGG